LPASAPRQEGRGNWVGIIALTLGAILVIAAWRYLRAWSSAGTRVDHIPDPGNVVIRPVSDGFWIDSGGLPVGTRIHYRCRLGGAAHEDRFTVAPGPSGLFVYTGDTPSNIVILDIEPPQTQQPMAAWDPKPLRGTGARPPRRTTRPTPPKPAPSPQPGWSGFPSAY
jgi:hypothetical protein